MIAGAAHDAPSIGRRLRELDPRIVDPAIAIVLLAVGLASMANSTVDQTHPTAVNPLGYLLAVVGFGALAVRTRAPLVAMALTLIAAAAYSAIQYPENGLPIAGMVALYTVASRTPRKQSLVAAGAVVVTIVWLTTRGSQGLDAAGAVSNLAVFGIAYATGRYVRVRRAYTEQLELRAAEADERRRRDAERAVAEERLRIARELHDVVAHAMSVVAVQSGIAAHVIEQRPDQARSMLETINGTSREALDEMRRLLGVLRSEGEAPEADLAPAPSLDDLGPLVTSIEGTGVTVEVSVEGEPVALPSGLDLAAFRITQEALTNVVKHAGPAHADVRIRYGTDDIEIEVADDGRGAASELGSIGGGHGLVGMRERVELYGGSLSTGPRPGGGFRVTARLPYRTGAVVR
ncbi:MAG: sensor histidine kinase [Acidimicrobiales bacterium]